MYERNLAVADGGNTFHRPESPLKIPNSVRPQAYFEVRVTYITQKFLKLQTITRLYFYWANRTFCWGFRKCTWNCYCIPKVKAECVYVLGRCTKKIYLPMTLFPPGTRFLGKQVATSTTSFRRRINVVLKTLINQFCVNIVLQALKQRRPINVVFTLKQRWFYDLNRVVSTSWMPWTSIHVLFQPFF